MPIKKADIESVAVKKEQYPPEDLLEVAFAGRSNVGKSSLLNLLTNRKRLAKISGSPGKTRTINFYRINDSFRIVDLPGYGYAKVPRKESEKWGKMIESYLENRKTLVKVAQLIDIRHKPTAEDRQMYAYLQYHGLDGLVVVTKADKVSKNEKEKAIKNIREILKLSLNDIVIPVSALKRTGQEELIEVLEELTAR